MYRLLGIAHSLKLPAETGCYDLLVNFNKRTTKIYRYNTDKDVDPKKKNDSQKPRTMNNLKNEKDQIVDTTGPAALWNINQMLESIYQNIGIVIC